MIASSGNERGRSMKWRKASLGTAWGTALGTAVGAAVSTALSAVLAPLPFPASAQAVTSSASGRAFSPGPQFAGTSGEELFATVCQSCHMPDGRGAAGAGAYPPLAGDPNLATSGYAVAVVVNGQRAMPPFGAMMSDEQVAAVVNYVRTHFGNRYDDVVTKEDVRAVRR
jgi:mono/diheme cytochrome c family protein